MAILSDDPVLRELEKRLDKLERGKWTPLAGSATILVTLFVLLITSQRAADDALFSQLALIDKSLAVMETRVEGLLSTAAAENASIERRLARLELQMGMNSPKGRE